MQFYVRDMALLLIAEHGDNVFAQTRHACAEAKADGDNELYELWEAIQTEVIEIGPTGTMYA